MMQARGLLQEAEKIERQQTRPADTILNEVGQPLQRNEDKLARWRRHFQGVLNVENAVAAEVLAEVEDNGDTDTPDVTREEVVKAVRRLQNGKAAGDDRIVAELLKSGGDRLVDKADTRSMANQEGAPRLEKCYIDTTFQEGRTQCNTTTEGFPFSVYLVKC